MGGSIIVCRNKLYETCFRRMHENMYRKAIETCGDWSSDCYGVNKIDLYAAGIIYACGVFDELKFILEECKYEIYS